MKTTVKLTSQLRRLVRDDLHRKHPYAAERVSFVFGRAASTTDGALIVLSTFAPVNDDDYERDDSVGARIGARAIHLALQRASTLGAAAFHIHAHLHGGLPRFSRTDIHELPDVMAPFAHVVPTQPRGLLLLSDDLAAGLVWHPGDRSPTPIAEIVSIGAPIINLSRAENDH